MEVTIGLVQLERKKKKDGTIPIYLRFTENRKVKYKSTGISVLPKHWNHGDQKVKKSHPRHNPINHELERLTTELKNIRLELKAAGNLSTKELKKAISEDKHYTLIDNMKEYEDSLLPDRYWEWKHFRVVKNQFEKFLKSNRYNHDADMTKEKITPTLLEDFQHYLMHGLGNEINKNGEKNNSPNTVRRKLRYLKGFFSELIKNREIEYDPFIYMDKVKEVEVKKTRLTLDQISVIEELDLKLGSRLWHVRNFFLYSFYNAGIRFGDLCTLKWNNIVDGRLEYKMRKTGGLKSIKQQKKMVDILDHYRPEKPNPEQHIFPMIDEQINDKVMLQKRISSQNALVNSHLKDIAILAKIDSNLSFHVSRHSFTQFALKNGFNIYELKMALGHSDLKTTERYINSFDEDMLDQSMDNLFGN